MSDSSGGSTTAVYGGAAVTVQDKCVRNRNGGCAIESVLSFFNYSRATLAAVTDLAAAIKSRVQLLRETLSTQTSNDGPSVARVVTITSTLDKQLEKARRKEERRANRKLASGSGESVMEWLQSVGVGFDVLLEGDWENQKTPSTSNPVSYTHLTLPTILLV